VPPAGLNEQSIQVIATATAYQNAFQADDMLACKQCKVQHQQEQQWRRWHAAFPGLLSLLLAYYYCWWW
jgi:hypothetical protein